MIDNSLRRKAGILLIILSTLASIVSFLFASIAWPVYLLGVILIWITTTKFKEKLLWTFLPIIFSILAWSLIAYNSNSNYIEQRKREQYQSTRYKEELDIILDNAFKGELVFVFNVPCGKEKKIKSIGISEVEMPNDGILLMRDSINFYNMKLKFYQVDSNGIREELKLLCTNVRTTRKVEVHQNHSNLHEIIYNFNSKNFLNKYLLYEVIRPNMKSNKIERTVQNRIEQKILKELKLCQ